MVFEQRSSAWEPKQALQLIYLTFFSKKIANKSPLPNMTSTGWCPLSQPKHSTHTKKPLYSYSCCFYKRPFGPHLITDLRETAGKKQISYRWRLGPTVLKGYPHVGTVHLFSLIQLKCVFYFFLKCIFIQIKIFHMHIMNSLLFASLPQRFKIRLFFHF